MNRILLSVSVLLVVSASAFATIHKVNSPQSLQNVQRYGYCAESDTIVLTRDIDMDGEDFSPLCKNGFAGVFDGGNYTISNLTISKSMVLHNNIAFIAILGEGGVLRNLTFDKPHIEGTQLLLLTIPVSEVSVAVAVGELRGGSVENVHVIDGTVSVDGTRTSNTIDAGGIAGTAESGAISESGGDIDVSNEGYGSVNVGGICGSVSDDVTLIGVSYDGDAPIAGATSGDNGISIKYGAVTVNEKNAIKRAVINGEYGTEDGETGIVNIPNSVEVGSVVLNRTFTKNTMSTLMLPFSIDTSKVKGGKIYKFKRVDEKEDGSWKVIIGKITSGQVGANTPYMVLPTDNMMTFEGAVTLNTTTTPIENLESDSWEYVGTYKPLDFDTVSFNGTMYGFAGLPQDGAKVGQFKKIGVGVTCNPLRAYLVRKDVLTKSAGNWHSGLLPYEIDIEIEDEKGFVVESGRLNTISGEVHMDHWFDLKGRKLKSRPFAKGSYYKNGKKAIIK